MIPALLLLLSLVSGPEQEVRAVLDAQVASWNRGDLPGFLSAYLHSEELTFFSGAAVTKGFAAIQARYEKRYGTSPETMGRLRFEDLEIQVLSRDAAAVRGRYRLEMKDSSPASGAIFIFSGLILWSRWEGLSIMHFLFHHNRGFLSRREGARMRANLGVLFHCLGIDVESGSAGEAFLKKLSKDNGGDFALVAP